MKGRVARIFAALVVAQAAHSLEEYAGRLWESFPPARWLTALLSSDRELGFIVLNVAIAALGLWCLLWPVRRRWQSARPILWLWASVEMVNGIVHPLWALRQGRYEPGVATAPILFGLGLLLANELWRTPGRDAP